MGGWPMRFPPWLEVLGDRSFRGECPSENAEMVMFFAVLRRELPEYGRIAIHPRNEGLRTMQQARRHKLEGMTTGAPDILIPCARPIIIELKRRDHTLSRLDDAQIEYLAHAQTLGARVYVALGWEAAIHVVRDAAAGRR